MSPKKSWITQIRPNEKRQQNKEEPGKKSQQEQQGQQQHSEYGKGSKE